ncbi:hypothetical protein GJ496_006523 [Pomphorhynchus laevis]|nr:hypothetical protein GJ496_006523 [Pomphorhynchus laevis]
MITPIDTNENAFTVLANFISKQEACSVTCSNGHILAIKYDFVPTGDWCERQKNHLQVDFNMPLDIYEDCCYVHDLCYQICNVEKKWCDRLFFECVVRTCKETSPQTNNQNTILKKCDMIGRMLHSTSVSNGCRKFIYMQNKACTCADLRQKAKQLNESKFINNSVILDKLNTLESIISGDNLNTYYDLSEQILLASMHNLTNQQT